MLHVMVDLETMGTRVGSAITAIGAHAFTLDYPGYTKDFHCQISLESAVAAGLTMDASTVVWWMKQSDAARRECLAANDGMRDLQRVLNKFTEWSRFLRTVYDGKLCFWGNSAAFDLGLLGEAYDRLSHQRPWGFREEACYRTLKNLRPDVVAPPFEGTQHNALHDARHQAAHLRLLLAAIAAPKPVPVMIGWGES